MLIGVFLMVNYFTLLIKNDRQFEKEKVLRGAGYCSYAMTHFCLVLPTSHRDGEELRVLRKRENQARRGYICMLTFIRPVCYSGPVEKSAAPCVVMRRRKGCREH